MTLQDFAARAAEGKLDKPEAEESENMRGSDVTPDEVRHGDLTDSIHSEARDILVKQAKVGQEECRQTDGRRRRARGYTEVEAQVEVRGEAGEGGDPLEEEWKERAPDAGPSPTLAGNSIFGPTAGGLRAGASLTASITDPARRGCCHCRGPLLYMKNEDTLISITVDGRTPRLLLSHRRRARLHPDIRRLRPIPPALPPPTPPIPRPTTTHLHSPPSPLSRTRRNRNIWSLPEPAAATAEFIWCPGGAWIVLDGEHAASAARAIPRARRRRWTDVGHPHLGLCLNFGGVPPPPLQQGFSFRGLGQQQQQPTSAATPGEFSFGGTATPTSAVEPRWEGLTREKEGGGVYIKVERRRYNPGGGIRTGCGSHIRESYRGNKTWSTAVVAPAVLKKMGCMLEQEVFRSSRGRVISSRFAPRIYEESYKGYRTVQVVRLQFVINDHYGV
ncbi:hypothetical protein C8F04DRAFT_1199878 [Mycena alexandri]|uniref:Uncharacterized protein n=1 Tax=Mycena alexandri TaxID=1745969 RepID=A0AAD6RYI9_9AGAR|nr:hypothetical protein C8F04DRAFT_1199878 [Mycena alexandri]